MPFFLFLPIAAFVVLSVVISTAKRKAQQEAANQRQQEAAAGTVQPPRPAPAQPRPVQRTAAAASATVRSQSQMNTPNAQPRPNPDHNRVAQKPAQMHPEHDLCALRPEESDAHSASKPGEHAPLDLNPDSILNGVILSEILGKPKALR